MTFSAPYHESLPQPTFDRSESIPFNMRDKNILTEQDVYYRLTTLNDINAEYDLMSQKYNNFVKENEEIRNISRQLNEDIMRFNRNFEYNEETKSNGDVPNNVGSVNKGVRSMSSSFNNMGDSVSRSQTTPISVPTMSASGSSTASRGTEKLSSLRSGQSFSSSTQSTTPSYVNTNTESNEVRYPNVYATLNSVIVADLISFSYQVSRGMEFLASRKVSRAIFLFAMHILLLFLL